MASEKVATTTEVASSSIHERLDHNAALLDGVSAALQEFIQSSDLQVARISMVLAETLDRVNAEISTLAMRLRCSTEESQGRDLAGTV